MSSPHQKLSINGTLGANLAILCPGNLKNISYSRLLNWYGDCVNLSQGLGMRKSMNLKVAGVFILLCGVATTLKAQGSEVEAKLSHGFCRLSLGHFVAGEGQVIQSLGNRATELSQSSLLLLARDRKIRVQESIRFIDQLLSNADDLSSEDTEKLEETRDRLQRLLGKIDSSFDLVGKLSLRMNEIMERLPILEKFSTEQLLVMDRQLTKMEEALKSIRDLSQDIDIAAYHLNRDLDEATGFRSPLDDQGDRRIQNAVLSWKISLKVAVKENRLPEIRRLLALPPNGDIEELLPFFSLETHELLQSASPEAEALLRAFMNLN